MHETPGRAEDHARWTAQRRDADRRTSGQLRELAAAIALGDASYLRLCDRLDDFGTRLAAVRLRLSTRPAGRPTGDAWKHETVAVSYEWRDRPRGLPVGAARLAPAR